MVLQNKQEFVNYLEPQQLGLSVAGSVKLIFSVRMMLEEYRSFICVKIDARNAFNSVFRAAIVRACLEEPSLAHLAWYAATSLAPYTALEDKGKLWGEAEEGSTQGAPLGSPWFCIAWHKFVRRLDAALAQVGGMARFGADDGYCIGPAAMVFQSLQKFEEEIKEFCGLVLQRDKCEVFSWDGQRPDGCLPGLIMAGATVEGVFQPGMLVYGAPVGTDLYVSHLLQCDLTCDVTCDVTCDMACDVTCDVT